MKESHIKTQDLKITLSKLKKIGFKSSQSAKSVYIDLGGSGLRLHYFPRDKHKFNLWGNMYDAGNVNLQTMVDLNIFIGAFIFLKND